MNFGRVGRMMDGMTATDEEADSSIHCESALSDWMGGVMASLNLLAIKTILLCSC